MANLAGVPATVKIFSEAEPVVDELRSQNIEPLLHMYSMFNPMICNGPVSTPEQAVGKIVRTGGVPWMAETEKLGMTHAFLPTTELYEALQRGVIDCGVLSANTIFESGLTEVTTATMLADWGPSAGSQIGFNKDSWDALPPEAPQIMHEATDAAQEASHEFPNVDALNEVIHMHR